MEIHKPAIAGLVAPYRGLDSVPATHVQSGLAGFTNPISMCRLHHNVFFYHQNMLIVINMRIRL